MIDAIQLRDLVAAGSRIADQLGDLIEACLSGEAPPDWKLDVAYDQIDCWEKALVGLESDSGDSRLTQQERKQAGRHRPTVARPAASGGAMTARQSAIEGQRGAGIYSLGYLACELTLWSPEEPPHDRATWFEVHRHHRGSPIVSAWCDDCYAARRRDLLNLPEVTEFFERKGPL